MCFNVPFDVMHTNHTKGLRMSQKQSGSAHVIIILALVAALIGALGWIFWQNFLMNPDRTPEQSERGETAPVSQVDAYKGVRTVSSGGVFSIIVPNGWKLMSNTVDDGAFGLDYVTTGPGIDGKIDYDESAKPVVTQTELGGWGGFAEYFTVDAIETWPEDAAAGAEFVLSDGTIGKKTESITEPRPGEEIYPTTDSYHSYRYLFKKDTVMVQVNFGVFAQNRDKHVEFIDDVVRSIEIN